MFTDPNRLRVEDRVKVEGAIRSSSIWMHSAVRYFAIPSGLPEPGRAESALPEEVVWAM